MGDDGHYIESRSYWSHRMGYRLTALPGSGQKLQAYDETSGEHFFSNICTIALIQIVGNGPGTYS